MKSIIGKLTVAVAAVLCASFTIRPGGEGFEVYLNNKLVTEQYGSNINVVKSLDLSSYSSSDKLTVKYYHCGRIGKNRVVTLKTKSDQVIRTFHYPDTKNLTAMEVPLKDVHQTAKLVYSSSELPSGRAIIMISPAGSLSKN